MTHRFSELTFTPAVIAAQSRFGTAEQADQVKRAMPVFDQLRGREKAFIENCDSFFMASVNEADWPYIQHRGGEKGFLHVISDTELAFANRSGNGQYQSVGNFSVNDRVCLFLIDYPNRRRLKLLGHVHCFEQHQLPDRLKSIKAFTDPESESVLLITLEAFDWNCPRYITPRFTEAEFATFTEQ